MAKIANLQLDLKMEDRFYYIGINIPTPNVFIIAVLNFLTLTFNNDFNSNSVSPESINCFAHNHSCVFNL